VRDRGVNLGRTRRCRMAVRHPAEDGSPGRRAAHVQSQLCRGNLLRPARGTRIGEDACGGSATTV
jgi:hypothetical protein